MASSVTNSIDSFPAGTQGVGMYLTITVNPTYVSFYHVQALEVPGPASNITGYFTNFDPAVLAHEPTPDWITLSEINQWGDHAGFSEWGQPWSPGGFDYDIPVQWKIGGSNTNNLPDRLQQHRITSSDGTSTVSKLGSSATRTP